MKFISCFLTSPFDYRSIVVVFFRQFRSRFKSFRRVTKQDPSASTASKFDVWLYVHEQSSNCYHFPFTAQSKGARNMLCCEQRWECMHSSFRTFTSLTQSQIQPIITQQGAWGAKSSNLWSTWLRQIWRETASASRMVDQLITWRIKNPSVEWKIVPAVSSCTVHFHPHDWIPSLLSCIQTRFNDKCPVICWGKQVNQHLKPFFLIRLFHQAETRSEVTSTTQTNLECSDDDSMELQCQRLARSNTDEVLWELLRCA